MGLIDEYRDLQRRLLPPGVIWRRAVDGEVGRWIAAFADEFARVHERAQTLVVEADPRTTDEMLAAWERNAGLPESCAPAALTLDERRAALTGRLSARGGQSIAYFVGLAATLGLTITISEFDPFVAGSPCGVPIGGDAWQFAYLVHAPAGPHVVAVAGSPAGCWLESWAQPMLECALRKLRPAHTFVLFVYS